MRCIVCSDTAAAAVAALGSSSGLVGLVHDSSGLVAALTGLVR